MPVGFRLGLHHHHSTPNLYRLGVFVSGFPDTARGSGPFCLRRAPLPGAPEWGRFDSDPPFLLSKPAPTSWRKRTQAALRHRDLHLRHAEQLPMALTRVSARSVQQRSGPLPLRKRTDQRHLGWLAPTASPHQVPPGNSRQNRVLPCADVTLIDPPWVCIMARVIANPSPAPSVSGCDRDGSAR